MIWWYEAYVRPFFPPEYLGFYVGGVLALWLIHRWMRNLVEQIRKEVKKLLGILDDLAAKV